MEILAHLPEINAIAEKKETLNASSMEVKCDSMKHITLVKLERHEHSTKTIGRMQSERY